MSILVRKENSNFLIFGGSQDYLVFNSGDEDILLWRNTNLTKYFEGFNPTQLEILPTSWTYMFGSTVPTFLGKLDEVNWNSYVLRYSSANALLGRAVKTNTPQVKNFNFYTTFTKRAVNNNTTFDILLRINGNTESSVGSSRLQVGLSNSQFYIKQKNTTDSTPATIVASNSISGFQVNFKYRIEGIVQNENINVNLVNFDTNAVISSLSHTTTLVQSGEIGFYGFSNTNIDINNIRVMEI